jgi:DNA replication protein DnaC
MTTQELINKITALPYDGQDAIDARDAFVSQFPRESIHALTKDQYLKNGDNSTFCRILEYTKKLPFGIGGGRDNKFGKKTADFPKVQGIYNMINDADNGIIEGLQKRYNLEDISVPVLIKILAIYLPDKFITIGQEYTLNLLGNIIGIKQQSDLIALNYKCNQKLRELNPTFSQYKFNQLGSAIWNILSPSNKQTFKEWIKKQSTEKSGCAHAYTTCIEVLSLYYKENYFSRDVNTSDLQTLYQDTLANQQKNGGKYYSTSPSYGSKYYYSSAVKKYIEYINFLATNQTNTTTAQSRSEIETEVDNTTLVSDSTKMEYPRNIILYGPPGTGKTYNTIRYAVSIINGLNVDIFTDSDSFLDYKGTEMNVKDAFDSYKDSGRIAFTTFHQSLSYEDFIEGIKPKLSTENDNILYKLEPGIFKELCNKARNHKDKRFVLIIDEINRGNVASIFGELITLIECDKREGKANTIECTLPYSKELFSVPDNLYIIGTMNTADRSVEALDSALRRRFDFIEMMPDSEKVTFGQDVFDCINNRLRILKDAEHQLGHSYFMGVNSSEDLCVIFQNKVIPLIQEYFYGDIDKIRLVIGDGFCNRESVPNTLFPNNTTDIDIPMEIWTLWDKNKWTECKNDISIFEEAIEKLLNG